MGIIRDWVRAGVASALAFGVAGFASAGPYTFTNVADTSGGYSAFSLPVANSSGTVAFTATTGGTAKIFSGNGGGVTTVFDPTGTTLSTVKGSPSLNNLGQVGFVASGPGPFGTGTNVYRVDAPGGAVTKIFDTKTYGASFAISVASFQVPDTVYLQYQGSLPRVGVVRGNGGTPTFLLTGSSNSGFHAAPGIGTSATGTNWVVPVSTDASGNYTDMVLNGTALHLTYSDTVPPFGATITGGFEHYSDADVNSDGTVVFSGTLGNTYDYLFVYKNGVLTPLIRANASGLQVYATPAINDNGVIAALFYGGTKSIKAGIGSPGDTVISVGDALAGSTATDLGFQKDGLSEGNQLTFTATLADGRTGVFVTQVPEPTALAWIVAAGGPLLSRRRNRRVDVQPADVR